MIPLVVDAGRVRLRLVTNSVIVNEDYELKQHEKEKIYIKDDNFLTYQ